MDFALSEEQSLLVGTARRFVENELIPHEDVIENTGEVDPALREEIKRKAIELGLYAANMPAEHGGAGLCHLDLTLLERELGRTSRALDVMVLRPAAILNACVGEQIEEYLKPTIDGDRVDCFGLTEPGAGSDAANISTKAQPNGDDFILNGRKHFISHADVADFAIVFAVTGVKETAKGPRKQITSFLVDKGTPGFEVTRMSPAVGNRGYHQCELTFDDCRIPKRKILGELHRGFDVANDWLLPNRLAIAANCIGKAQRVLALAVEWAAQRKTFGQPIGRHQAIGFTLADRAMDLRAAEFITLDAAWRADRGTMTDGDAAMAKVFSSEALWKVVDDAVQVFGGMGVMADMPIQRFWRDARVERIWDGTSEIQRLIVARELLRSAAA